MCSKYTGIDASGDTQSPRVPSNPGTSARTFYKKLDRLGELFNSAFVDVDSRLAALEIAHFDISRSPEIFSTLIRALFRRRCSLSKPGPVS